jgi:dUTP pyrophosphatase
VVVIPLGVKVEIPEGYELQIRPRSGLAFKHGITIPNSPGTIDSGFRGELMVKLLKTEAGKLEINPGDRVCQAILNKVPKANFVKVDKVSESSRGEDGFGSSGVK